MKYVWRVVPWFLAFVAILLVIHSWGNEGVLSATITRQDSVTAERVSELDSMRRENARTKQDYARAQYDADRFRRRAEPMVDTLRTVATSLVAVPLPRDSSSADTVELVRIARSADTTVSWIVPRFVVEERVFLVRMAFILDSAWKAERDARMFADSVVIPDLRRQNAKADEVIESQRIAIQLRDRTRGRRCGVSVGYGLVATGRFPAGPTVGASCRIWP
jgi:hypothetical protein